MRLDSQGLITLFTKTLSLTLIVVLFSLFFTGTVHAQAAGDKICEVCGMRVSPEAQARYLATDQTGSVHYVECFMCALNLVKLYNQLDIISSCDWFGPDYSITVTSKNFGKDITIYPPSAMFLNGGNCVINRAAYNQTAAEALLTNGYSQFTLSDQQYTLPSNTKVTTVLSAAMEYGKASATTDPFPTNTVLVAVAAIGVVVMVGSVLAFRKLKQLTTNGDE